MRLQVITGTTRQGRFSERVAAWVTGRLAERDAFEVELVDLRDHPLTFFDGDPPARTGRDYADEAVVRFGRVIDRADGYVVLTAEYNHGYPAVLKNALDSTFVEWRRKPVAFVGWGNTGGARAVEQLRAVAVEFEMAPLRHAVHVLPDVMRAIFGSDDPDDRALRAARIPAGPAGRRPRMVDAGPRDGAGGRRVDRGDDGQPTARPAPLRRPPPPALPRARRRPARGAVLLPRVVDRRRAVAPRVGRRHHAPPSGGCAGRRRDAGGLPAFGVGRVERQVGPGQGRATPWSSDEAVLEALEAVGAPDRARLTFPMGPLTFDFDQFAALRLNEHALHTWDIEVVFDETAHLPHDAAAVVVDNLGLIARFTGRPTGATRDVVVGTTDPAREFTVRLAVDAVDLGAGGSGRAPDLVLPAEAFCRLVYGRLDPAHTPAVTGDGAVLDSLRAVFPGP